MMAEHAYWVALAHLPGWRSEKINELVMTLLHKRKLSFAEFFDMSSEDWHSILCLGPKESADLIEAKRTLPEITTLVKELQKHAIDIVPVWSEVYPQVLKENLALKYSPPVLYMKGNKGLTREPTVAVVGARNAGPAALRFTDVIAKKCVQNRKVVVSGLAKGVDQAALASTLKYKGQSIVVLPQGILSSTSEFKKRESQIKNGDILFISTFFPRSPWSVGLAMARNVYIYGLAEEIYVAESGPHGGTWSGAMDGLKKGRRVYVREPLPGEENANELLISHGAVPVDQLGNRTRPKPPKLMAPMRQLHLSGIKDDLEMLVRMLLSDLPKPLSSRAIKEHLQLDIKPRQLSRLLRDMSFIEVLRSSSGRLVYTMKKLNE